MSDRTYKVKILYYDGAEESRTDLNILHDYTKSCMAAERAMEFNENIAAVSVENDLGVTIFFKDRWAQIF